MTTVFQAAGSRPQTIRKLTPEEFAARKARKEATAIEEDRKAQEAKKAEYLKGKLGRRFRSRTFDSYDVTAEPQNSQAYNVCKRYANREDYTDGNGLMIMGPNGVGKTHMAAAICNALVDRGIPCLYDTYVGHLAKLQAEFNGDGDRVWLDMMKSVKVLILDDVGKEKATDWTRSVMFDVINYRYEADKPTIITTNYSEAQLRDYLGAATYSRICETCPCLVMTGQDYRMR